MGNNKRQTAVKWIECELARRKSIIDSEPDGFVKQSMCDNLYIDLFDQAKEIEKEQIMNAFLDDLTPSKQNIKEAEQYYNETYKN